MNWFGYHRAHTAQAHKKCVCVWGRDIISCANISSDQEYYISVRESGYHVSTVFQIFKFSFAFWMANAHALCHPPRWFDPFRCLDARYVWLCKHTHAAFLLRVVDVEYVENAVAGTVIVAAAVVLCFCFRSTCFFFLFSLPFLSCVFCFGWNLSLSVCPVSIFSSSSSSSFSSFLWTLSYYIHTVY